MMTEIVWSSFHFLRPLLLWLLIPAGLLLYFWLNNTSRQDGWQQSCDPELLQAMQIQSASRATRWTWLYWPITLLTILALAGPAVRQLPVPMVKNQSALIVALDVSKSMLSDDLKPSRLQRAKFKIQDLLDNRKDGQTALVVYSGDAFVVTPLTDDTETIVSLLDVVDPSIMPVSGTNTVVALDKATELLAQAGINKGQILLVTDSIDMYKTESRLTEVNEAGITVHVLAVGTAEGAPIPTNQGFLKDLRGQIVIPQVDYSSLQQAAQIGQGRFSVLSNSVTEDQLYEVRPENNANNAEGDDEAGIFDEQGGENFIDDGPLLALLIIPLLALLYRRGILMVLCLGFMLNSENSYALSWDDLWLNQDQQAYRQLESAPAEAYNQAENKRIKAAAAYKKQDFKAAKNLYPEQGESLQDYYNLGNALAQAGELEQALESYQQALTYEPEDADTLYNKSIVEQALQQQQQQNQDSQENQENQENQDPQDSEQNQQDQQDQQQQQSSEQEKQEQQQQAQQDQQAEADKQQTDEASDEQQQAEQQEQQAEQQEQPQEIELTPEEKALDAEEKQAMEQWLRRIKDDPGGLMRRKFLYQYHKRNQNGESYDNQTTEDW